jgi:uncharacterized cupredoxin-like copper-binding protein
MSRNLKIKIMRKLLLLILLSFISSFIYAKSYKINLKLKNSSDEKISISYQKGFVLDASNGSNVYIGDLDAGEVKSFTDQKITVEKGETIFIIINLNGSNISVANYRVQDSPPKILSFDIHLPEIKNSNTPINSQSELESFLQKFGSNDISSGKRLRVQVNIPLSKGMNTICGGLVVVDMLKLKDGNEFEIGDIEYIVPSYVLKTTPVKIEPSGKSILDEFEYESDIALSASSNFPLAGSLNFGFSNANYYKSKIEVKEAGWIPLENPSAKGYVSSLAAIDDFDTQLNYAIDIKSKLDNCPNCRVYTVEYAFFFESLVLTTSKYDKFTGTSDASVSSVVTINGTYKRKESKDYSNSCGSTIAYISLTNNVTTSIKNAIEIIIEKAYLQEKLSIKTYDLQQTTLKNNKELKELGIKIDENKSFNIKNYIDQEKLNLINSFSNYKLNNELKNIEKELK